MILYIPGPVNSSSTTINVHDIVRLETCVLKFFGRKLYNLYIILKADAGESFHLFTYARNENFKAAFTSLSDILKETPAHIDTIQIEPFPSIEPSHGKGVLQPAV